MVQIGRYGICGSRGDRYAICPATHEEPPQEAGGRRVLTTADTGRIDRGFTCALRGGGIGRRGKGKAFVVVRRRRGWGVEGGQAAAPLGWASTVLE